MLAFEKGGRNVDRILYSIYVMGVRKETTLNKIIKFDNFQAICATAITTVASPELRETIGLLGENC